MENKDKLGNKLPAIKWSHNASLILLSLVLSFVSWLMILDYENPRMEKVFHSVPIKYLGQAQLYNRNLHVETPLNFRVDITIVGKRNSVIKQTIDDVSAEVDLSKVGYGLNYVPITFKSKDRDIDIRTTSIDNLEIYVDNLLSKKYDIQLFAEGKIEKPYYVFTANTVPASVSIAGPEKLLNSIDKVFALYDVNQKQDDFTHKAELNIVDANGDFIQGLETSEKEVDINVKIGLEKEVPLKTKFVDFEDEDFTLADYQFSSEKVKIKGHKQLISPINELQTKPIKFAPEVGEQEIDLEFELPAGVELVANQQLKVKAKVDKEETRSIEVNVDQLAFQNLDDKLTAKLVDDVITVELKALSSVWEEKDIEPKFSLDLDGLKAGEHSLPLRLEAPSTYQLVDQNVAIIIAE